MEGKGSEPVSERDNKEMAGFLSLIRERALRGGGVEDREERGGREKAEGGKKWFGQQGRGTTCHWPPSEERGGV